MPKETIVSLEESLFTVLTSERSSRDLINDDIWQQAVLREFVQFFGLELQIPTNE